MGLAAQAGNLIIITNRNVAMSSVTRAEAQNIFLGKNILWSDGKKINPAVLKSGATHEMLLKDVFAKSS